MVQKTVTIPRDGLETENVKDYVVKYLVKSSSHTVGSEHFLTNNFTALKLVL